MPTVIQVVVPVPGLGALSYGVPDELGPVEPGMRVLVPLGSRTVTGVVIGAARTPVAGAHSVTGVDGVNDVTDLNDAKNLKNGKSAKDVTKVKNALDVLDVEPFLPEEVLELALWAAEYYAAGPGETVAAAMPPFAWVESERRVRLSEKGRAALAQEGESGLRVAVLQLLAEDRTLTAKAVTASLDAGVAGKRSPRRGLHAVIGRLARDGLLVVEHVLKSRASAHKTVRIVAVTAQGHDVVRRPSRAGPEEREPLVLGARQREALDLLIGSPGGMPSSTLRAQGVSSDTVGRLVRRGLASVTQARVERDPFELGVHEADSSIESVAGDDLVPTDEQARALERLTTLVDDGGFHVAALHGVTGSGKTEIYLRLARAVVGHARTVLILVPEIALTPAVASRFRRAFGDAVAIQHSGLSSGERHDQWQRIRRREVSVVVGTRSAVFAPLANLGLIIVDEEHDSSYKQDESPRYHGRDLAVVRGRRRGALVVLGSATPSLETYQNTLDGRYERIVLERRVLDRPLAVVEVVDMRAEYAARGPEVVLSGRLVDSLEKTFGRREQAMLLLNRRGFATSVFCRQCAASLECPNCSVSLTVHRAAGRARCHYCDYSTAVPRQCAACGGPFLEQIGFGTERVEAVVRELFPDVRIARLDRDTVRRRGAAAEILRRFAREEIDVMVGTQMVAKGHDFPAVTLVGVISADVGLGLADFRAAERTFQLLTQVAGRAGRGTRAGQAIVQTLYPEHASIRHACRQDYCAFFEEEIRFRRAMRYPPTLALVNVIVRARERRVAFEDAASVVRDLRPLPGFRVLGPAPAPFGKLRGEHRVQFFLKGVHRGVMRRALLASLERHPDVRRRVTIDVDPLSVL